MGWSNSRSRDHRGVRQALQDSRDQRMTDFYLAKSIRLHDHPRTNRCSRTYEGLKGKKVFLETLPAIWPTPDSRRSTWDFGLARALWNTNPVNRSLTFARTRISLQVGLTRRFQAAVKEADIVYTDVWSAWVRRGYTGSPGPMDLTGSATTSSGKPNPVHALHARPSR